MSETGQISDGYHTFDELYDHRIALYITLCKILACYTPAQPWRSEIHADGTRYEDWFIMGIGKEKGKQISYHLPMSKWKETEFAETLEKAPEWDGHSSADVVKRLNELSWP